MPTSKVKKDDKSSSKSTLKEQTTKANSTSKPADAKSVGKGGNGNRK